MYDLRSPGLVSHMRLLLAHEGGDIFKKTCCQTDTWLEARTEKRAVIKQRFHLFQGVHESSVWQHRKRKQGWVGRTS